MSTPQKNVYTTPPPHFQIPRNNPECHTAECPQHLAGMYVRSTRGQMCLDIIIL